MKIQHAPWGRLLTAMVTPFTQSDTIDVSEAIRLATHLIAHGSDGIVLAGTTGESPTLTHEEESWLFSEIRHALHGKTTLIAGTGSNCTKTAVRATQNAEKLGMDGVLQVVPYYNRPSQTGIYHHFRSVAESTSLPILLYNIPGRTGQNMTPDTIEKLSAIPNIIGVKESAGSLEQLKMIVQNVPPDFLVYSGDDGLTLPFIEAGAWGVVSVAAHIVGDEISRMITAFIQGDQKTATEINTKLMPFFKSLFITTNPSPVKAMLRHLGFSVGAVRLPLIDVTDPEWDVILSEFQRLP